MTKEDAQYVEEGRLGAAPWDEVGQLWEIADAFMFRIFGITPYQYMITDRSWLSDFRGLNDLDQMADIYRKINEEYGIDVSGIKDGNLLDIFRIIAQHGLN